MALERVPADIRATGGVARMASARLRRRASVSLEHIPSGTFFFLSHFSFSRATHT